MASSLAENTNNDTPLANGTQTSLVMDDGNEEDPIKILGTNINAMFLVLMGTLIIFMQAGFGFLEAGSIRAKNTTNILIKNFADLTFGNIEFGVSKEDQLSKSVWIYSFAELFDMRNLTSFIGGLGFWFVGYGLAFGEGNNGVIGTSYFAAIGLPLELYTHLFFQVAKLLC